MWFFDIALKKGIGLFARSFLDKDCFGMVEEINKFAIRDFLDNWTIGMVFLILKKAKYDLVGDLYEY